MKSLAIESLNKLMHRNLKPVDYIVNVNELVEFFKLPYGMFRVTDRNGNDYYGMEKDLCMTSA